MRLWVEPVSWVSTPDNRTADLFGWMASSLRRSTQRMHSLCLLLHLSCIPVLWERYREQGAQAQPRHKLSGWVSCWALSTSVIPVAMKAALLRGLWDEWIQLCREFCLSSSLLARSGWFNLHTALTGFPSLAGDEKEYKGLQLWSKTPSCPWWILNYKSPKWLFRYTTRRSLWPL